MRVIDDEPFDRVARPGIRPVGRFELLEAARRRGWPRYVDERGTVFEGRVTWCEAAWVYAADRRAAWNFLRQEHKR